MQDTILFLMVREILGGVIDLKAQETPFKLYQVCDKHFLSHAVRAEFKVPVEWDKKKKKVVREVTVYHENMSLKNFGEMSRLVNDSRTLSLLKHLRDDRVEYTDLCGELDYYDQKRSEVFEIVQSIERLAYERNRKDLDDENSEGFYYTDQYGNRNPVRINFLALLNLVTSSGADAILSEDEKELLRQARNAFGHNTYDVNFGTVRRQTHEDIALPKVAALILKCIEGYRKTIGG